MGNGQGLYIRNETDRPILYVLSQLTPLHWGRAEPGEEVYVDCGKVWFTVSVGDWDPAKMPTRTGVAANVAAITAGALVFGLAGVGVAGFISGVAATLKCKMNGVYADGRTLVVRYRERTPGFFFAAVEYLDASNHKVVRAIEAEAAEEKSNEDDVRSIGGAPVVVAKMVIPDVDG